MVSGELKGARHGGLKMSSVLHSLQYSRLAAMCDIGIETREQYQNHMVLVCNS